MNQYKLDDDVEYHNPAEPSTTSCPMLPGQVVNVLNVPMHFSSGRQRHRNASVSSTSSELRTMNPEDKYLNPRPAPEPTLARLNTSATHKLAAPLQLSPSTLSPSSSKSSHRRNISLPSSAVSLRSFRLPRKPALDGRGRSASPAHRATGLKSAFRHFAPVEATSPEAISNRGRSGFSASDRGLASWNQAPASDRVSKDQANMITSADTSSMTASRSRSPTATVRRLAKEAQIKPLVLRRSIEQPDNVDEGFAVSSFQNHRRQRSRSREPSPLRNSSVSSEQAKGEAKVGKESCQHYLPLESLKEVLSPQSSYVWPLSTSDAPRHESGAADPISEAFHKRLPTLPITLSSAYPASEHYNTPPSNTSKELKGLENEVLKVTVSDEDPSSTVQSHFSHWTGTTTSSYSSSQWSSVFLDGKSPSYSEITRPSSHLTSPYEIKSMPDTPDATKGRLTNSVPSSNRMPSIVSSSTISSDDNTSPSSPASEASDLAPTHKNEPTSSQKRYGIMLGGFQCHQLPDDSQAAEADLKSHLLLSADGRPIQNIKSNHPDNGSPGNTPIHDFPHSTNMQQLLEELKYLGTIIRE